MPICLAMLLSKVLAQSAIAGEVVEGPYQSACQQVEASGLTEFIKVRKGNGLDVIKQGEVDCIIIAGMGGALITEILERGKEKLDDVKRLILQPNIASENVREWLLENNWQLVDEQLIEEDRKFYEVLVAEQGNAKEPYTELKKELMMGPFLLKKKDETFNKKWRQEIHQWERILNELNKADDNESITRKRQELIERMKIVKGEV